MCIYIVIYTHTYIRTHTYMFISLSLSLSLYIYIYRSSTAPWLRCTMAGSPQLRFIHIRQLLRIRYTCFERDAINNDWWTCISVCLVGSAAPAAPCGRCIYQCDVEIPASVNKSVGYLFTDAGIIAFGVFSRHPRCLRPLEGSRVCRWCRGLRVPIIYVNEIIYVFVYIYVYIHSVCIYIYIYIYT